MATNSIIVKRYLKIHEEFTALEAVKPGMLLILDSAKKVKKHNVAGGNVFPLVAFEGELLGRTVNDAYEADDKVECLVPTRGDVLQLRLADGQNIAFGDALESDGLGQVRKHTVEALASADAQQVNTIYSNPIVGYADEAKDLSILEGSDSSLAANSQLIRVRIA